MKNHLLFLITFGTSILINAQVGINTNSPVSTLEIKGKETDLTAVDGFIAPRISLLNLNAKASLYSAAQTGAIVYINSITGATGSGSTANIDAVGYYYFDGSIWIKLKPSAASTNIYTDNGTLTGNRTVTQGDKSLKFTSSITDAFSVDGSTFSVDAANNKVGIGTKNPNSTLTINGSFEGAYKEVTASTTLTDTDYYITYNGAANGIITLPVVASGTTSFTGRIYRIKNVSSRELTIQPSSGNSLRADVTPVTSYKLGPGTYVEIVNNSNSTGATWDISFIGKPTNTNVEIYGAQLKIPPHRAFAPDFTGHSVSTYDTPASGSDSGWHIISKTSTDFEFENGYAKASKMVIVYEYQGTPFTLTNMYPILTPGNDQSYPDLFNANFVTLLNNGTGGKTRLTVVISRAEYIGDDNVSSSNWQGTFLLNILLARKTN